MPTVGALGEDLAALLGAHCDGCPSMGGDFGEDWFGAAFPTNYQEHGPLCDGVVVDIKFYANLDGADWDDENKNLPNNIGSRNGDGSTVLPGELVKNYLLDDGTPDVAQGILVGHAGRFGVISDPYLTDRIGYVNRDEFESSDVGDSMAVPGGATGNLHDVEYPSANDQVECTGGNCPLSP